jgi:hypothetical protein
LKLGAGHGPTQPISGSTPADTVTVVVVANVGNAVIANVGIAVVATPNKAVAAQNHFEIS